MLRFLLAGLILLFIAGQIQLIFLLGWMSLAALVVSVPITLILGRVWLYGANA